LNPGEIYAKTDEGVRELKERKLNLPIALRSVLIMVDGNRTVARYCRGHRPCASMRARSRRSSAPG